MSTYQLETTAVVLDFFPYLLRSGRLCLLLRRRHGAAAMLSRLLLPTRVLLRLNWVSMWESWGSITDGREPSAGMRISKVETGFHETYCKFDDTLYMI